MTDSIEAKQAKHTPGPWMAQTRISDHDILPGSSFHIAVVTRANDVVGLDHLQMVNGDYHVCKFNPTKSSVAAEKMEADARLIAAAPELLEAVKAAKKYLEPDLVEPGRTVFWKLVAAISKAEG